MNEHYERAALFQPFDSLKGFRSQLKQQERVIVERPQLFEEELQMLDQKRHRLLHRKRGLPSPAGNGRSRPQRCATASDRQDPHPL